MPRKSLSTAHRQIVNPTSSTTNNSDNINDKEPSWDTSPNTFPAYLAALKRWIYKQDERFKPIVEFGYVNIKGNIYCMSDNHIDRIRAALDPLGTLPKPR